jgi:hypothetical protein
VLFASINTSSKRAVHFLPRPGCECYKRYSRKKGKFQGVLSIAIQRAGEKQVLTPILFPVIFLFAQAAILV